MGTYGLVWIVIGALLAYLWRRPALYTRMLLALATAELTARALKQLVTRDRPSVRFPTPEPLVFVPHSSSFPSAHSATAFACAATLAAGASRRLAAVLFLLAAAIAFSRVYVGVHYPLDVLAGAALGLLVALVVRLLTGPRLRAFAASSSGSIGRFRRMRRQAGTS